MAGRKKRPTKVPSTSESKKFREQGNTAYKALVAGDNLAPVVWTSRFHKTLALYEQALATASDESEASSAGKNLGRLHSRAANRSNTLQSRIKQQCLAIKYWSEAMAAGIHEKSDKEDDWLDALFDDIISVRTEALDLLDNKELDVVLSGRAQLTGSIHPSMQLFRAGCLEQDSRKLFQIGVVALEGSAVTKALKCMKEAMPHAVRAQQLCRSNRCSTHDEAADFAQLLEQLLELEEDIALHQLFCESIQERQKADKMLESSLADSESIDMEQIFGCIDSYKHAIILTRAKDIYNEAVATARLGRLYAKILRDQPRAELYLRQARQLAGALHPVPVMHYWYQELVAQLAEYQKQAFARDAEKLKKERAPILEELREELAALNAAFAKNAKVLLDHVYEKHPPKNPDHKKGDTGPEELKRSLYLAATHYHPDRNLASKYGSRWTVMAEEITKQINRMYEKFK